MIFQFVKNPFLIVLFDKLQKSAGFLRSVHSWLPAETPNRPTQIRAYTHTNIFSLREKAYSCRICHSQATNVWLSSLFSFIALWYNSTASMPIVQIVGSGVAGTVTKTNRRPVGQLYVCIPGKFFIFVSPVDHILQSCLFSPVSITFSSTLSGTFSTHSFGAGFSLFWSCRVNGFRGSSNTCVSHKFMSSSSSLPLASCLRRSLYPP